MLEFRLSIKNLLGAKLRTFLNLFVLSISFVVIILLNSLMDGWDAQAKKDSVEWEYGSGHLLNENYDPLDSFSILDGHAQIPDNANNLTPILVHQATIYPDGRMMSIKINGIPKDQKSIKIPTAKISANLSKFPALIGKRMAESANISIGDEVLIRWRDKNGTFDAKWIA